MRLPLNFELAAIFRHQSGFPFSRRSTERRLDIDGNQAFNTRDFDFERNCFEAPDYTTLDARVAWSFDLGAGRRHLSCSSSSTSPTSRTRRRSRQIPGGPVGFGEPLQVLPGREAQLGVRFEFGGS